MIIIGGGIIGASFAYHASLLGLDDVKILTSTLPGDQGQATSNTWGWVNGYSQHDKNYAAFRLANIKYWPKLIDDVINIKKSSVGAYFWDAGEDELTTIIRKHKSWEHAVMQVNQEEMSNHLPNLLEYPIKAGFGKDDLALEGPKVTSELIKASGYQIKKVNINKLIYEKNRVRGVETEQGMIYTDEVIIAAGLGTPNLISTLNINFKMNSSLGLLAFTNQLPKSLLKYPITGKDFHARQDDKGRLVIGGKFDDDASNKNNFKQVAEKLVKDMRSRLNYDGEIKLDHYTLGYRPLPIDGRPKIGRLKNKKGKKIDGVYVAVMHSGITNAPLAGKLGIEEIVTGKRHSLLADFHPQILNKEKKDKNV